MKTLEIQDVQEHFTSVLITMKADGEGILICQDGEPVAELLPRYKALSISEPSSQEGFLQKIEPLVKNGTIVLPTKPLRKASMPTIQVEGTPLSQIILEDRR